VWLVVSRREGHAERSRSSFLQESVVPTSRKEREKWGTLGFDYE
jgi:hypothetical protein